MLDAGVCATVKDLAERERVNAGYLSRVLRLTLLAPDTIEVILDGRQLEGMRLENLLKGFPVQWEGQPLVLAIKDRLVCAVEGLLAEDGMSLAAAVAR